MPLLRPPGPKPHFPIGNFPLGSADPLGTFLRWAREFGDIFYYRAGWIQVYFLNRPDFIETVLVNQTQNFRKDHVVQNSRWFLGEGLLTNEGAPWLRQRRLSQPAFHRDRITAYAKTMSAQAEKEIAGWKDGEVHDLNADMMRLTLEIVAKVLFSTEMAEETAKLGWSMNMLMQHTTGGRMVLPPFIRHLPLPFLLRVKRAVRQLDETVYGIIRRRHAQETDNGDLLAMLMQARDEDGSRMTDQQLRDEVMTFILAGHETTALALSWTFYLLGENPEAEEKLHQELEHVLAGRTPEAKDLPQLPYTEKVVKESMRLYPPAWSLARSVVTETEIGGFRIPVGANIVMSQWIMHRDPRFFPDSERFLPERWTAGLTQSLPRFAYFPFGGGPRICIGAAFAMTEACLLLATIAQRIEFRLEPGHPVIPTPSLTLRPKHGIRMSLRRR